MHSSLADCILDSFIIFFLHIDNDSFILFHISALALFMRYTHQLVTVKQDDEIAKLSLLHLRGGFT